MAKQDIAFEVYYDGAWRDIIPDDDVFSSDPIVISRGQGTDSQGLRPSQVTATLANDDDRYRTSNPESPLYGKAGRNTPVRVSIDGVVRQQVQATSWECTQSRDFRRTPRRGRSSVAFEGGGQLERIGQWTEPLKSPFRKYNESLTNLGGYFHGEQERGSTELVSTVGGTSWDSGFGGNDNTLKGLSFDSQHRPPGSAPLFDVEEGAAVGLFFNTAGTPVSSTAGWQLSWATRSEDLGGAGLHTAMNWLTSDTTGYRLDILPGTNQLRVIAEDDNGVLKIDFTVSSGTYDFTQWTLWSIDAQYSGVITNVYVNWTNADNSQTGFFLAGNYIGPPSALMWASFVGLDDEVMPGSTMGHITAANVSSTGGTDLFSAARLYAWTGYLGELSAVRFDRLCNESNVESYVSPSWADSTPMGPQPVASLIEQFDDIATTEDGLVFDHREDPNLYFLVRADRYNRTPTVALHVEDLITLPAEVTDNAGVANVVTAAQRDGGEATATDSTGPLGSQAPPDGVGEWRREVPVNLATPADDLAQHANWHLRRGTVDLPRYPRVAVNVTKLDTATRAGVVETDVGDVITISGFRENVLRLHVLGYTETITTHNRIITYVTAPDRQFDAGVWDDTTHRWDSDSSTIAAVDAAATSWTISTPDPRSTWSTTATPYELVAAGEVVLCTSMGAVSGSGPYSQTAVVQRSYNGVRKRHTADTPVHVYRSGRWAL